PALPELIAGPPVNEVIPVEPEGVVLEPEPLTSPRGGAGVPTNETNQLPIGPIPTTIPSGPEPSGPTPAPPVTDLPVSAAFSTEQAISEFLTQANLPNLSQVFGPMFLLNPSAPQNATLSEAFTPNLAPLEGQVSDQALLNVRAAITNMNR